VIWPPLTLIEHSHGTGTAEFRRWLYQNPAKNTLEDYKEGYERLYRKKNGPETIGKDVAGLIKLHDWVYEHNGAYPPRDMR
jgi:hypothetical protein